jgi:hypothetical protein
MRNASTPPGRGRPCGSAPSASFSFRQFARSCDTAFKPTLSGVIGSGFVLNFPCRGPHDMDRVADHISGAFSPLGPRRHYPVSRFLRWNMRDLSPMSQYLIWAMEGRGEMSNRAIYRAVKAVCETHGRKLPPDWEAEIRQTLQACCPGRPQHNGRDDFFVWHGRGYWSCKVTSPTLEEL